MPHLNIVNETLLSLSRVKLFQLLLIVEVSHESLLTVQSLFIRDTNPALEAGEWL